MQEKWLKNDKLTTLQKNIIEDHFVLSKAKYGKAKNLGYMDYHGGKLSIFQLKIFLGHK